MDRPGRSSQTWTDAAIRWKLSAGVHPRHWSEAAAWLADTWASHVAMSAPTGVTAGGVTVPARL